MILHIHRRRLVWMLCAVVLCASVLAAELSAVRRRATDATAGESMPVITLDAGHGGFDGGTTAADGTQEKDINLAIALPTADLLRLCGVRVVLTRERDEALCEEAGLRIRDKKVRDMKERLALFEQAQYNISLHQNAFSGTKYHGTQVFYSANHPESRALALVVQQQVVKWLQPDNTREIKSGNRDIYLLHKATKPTVLVECGFLSNTAECEKLKTEEYQQAMAWTLAMGLMQHMTVTQGGMNL